MIQTLSTVMQLFKGSYFSVAAGSRNLWPNSAIAKCTTYVNYVSSAATVKYKKSYFSKVYKWNVNNWYLDTDFHLRVCGVIVFLEVWTRADSLKLYRVN